MTNLKLKSLKPKEKDYLVSVGGGMSVRVYPSGKKKFIYRYKITGQKEKKHVIGEYPEISLSKARELKTEAAKKVKKGIDINTEKKIEKAIQISSPLISELVAMYSQRYLNKHIKKPQLQIRLLEVNILPVLGSQKAKDVIRAEIIYALEKVTNQGKMVTANRTLSRLKHMFRWAVENEILESSPAELITKKNTGGTEKSRQRYFTESEIKYFLIKLESITCSIQIKLVLKLLLYAGQRIGETTSAEWHEVDFKNRIWTIPKEKSKTKEQNRIYMSDLIIDIFKQCKLLSNNSNWVFANPKTPDKHITYQAVDRAVSRSLSHFTNDDTNSQFEKWTPHDLRRTVETQLNEIGIAPHIADRMANHKLQGIQAIYNKAEYWKEKKEGWERWSEKIKQILAGKKIIPFKKQKFGK